MEHYPKGTPGSETWTDAYREQRRAEAAAYDASRTSQAILFVKEEAERRIGLLFGGKSGQALIWAQMNAVANQTHPTAEVNAIRTASDAIEARLTSEPDLDIANAPEWP